ncbi:MAG TPA: site-specific integrase [Firmicutes bacterium]|nr:site-specific integrase [Bacillota bacterium]
MAGSIRKRGENSWEIKAELGRDPMTGKRRRIFKTIRGTKRDAEKALRDILRSIDEGTFSAPSKITLAEFLVQWLQIHKAQVATTTWEWYDMICHKHIIPELGHIPLQKLTPLAVQSFYAKKLDSKTLDGKGRQLSPSSVRHIHRVLHKALNHALKMQLISRNPCDAVEPPKPQKKEAKFWTPEEAGQFLEAIRDDRLYALFHLALGTGLRRGELLGLKWESIDFAKGTLTVKEELVRRRRGTLVKEPKTEKSRRTIPLSQETLDVLKAHKVAQNKERLLLGDQYQNNGLVFTTVDGRPLEPTYISGDYFHRMIKKAGVREINFHALRHTHATLLGAAGVPIKAVSERLGHSSIAITGDIYSHVFSEMDRQAANAFDTILRKARVR